MSFYKILAQTFLLSTVLAITACTASSLTVADGLQIDQNMTQEQILAELVDKPYFSPANGWHYSTTNYILLRMIVEKATG
ncbi:MAG: beta-lactamase family protein [bacterium]|nr:beta-lactamase family protein [bacterium]